MSVAQDNEQGSKVNLERADILENGTKDGESFQKLIGNVLFSQNDTKIYCDSAYLFKITNSIEAYGYVKVIQGDTITITGRKLIYLGNDRIAQMRNDVEFKTPSTTLYTDHLDFDRNEQLAYYFQGGKLIDSTNQVTSDKGYYLARTKIISFKKEVVLTNDSETLESDTLVYNTRTRVAFFVAPTKVTDEDGNVANYNEGSYNTKIKKSILLYGDIESEDYILSGNKLFLDNLNGYYRVTKNVVMTHKKEDMIIYGDVAEHWKNRRFTKIYGNPLVKKVVDQDTLYLRADTLIAIDSQKEEEKKLIAFDNVRIYKTDLQGLSDSLVYVSLDSMFYFRKDPILWTTGTQVTADSINLLIRNKTLDQMNMYSNSFLIYEDSLLYHNQVKGRNMVAYFEKEELHKIDVDGNGESIYFALDEKTADLVGMNKILCSTMTIKFDKGKVQDIFFYTNPDATFIPPHELADPDKTLKNYDWRSKEKPQLETILSGEPAEDLTLTEESVKKEIEVSGLGALKEIAKPN
ncbi:MAG: OstA-like protein [Bacteroidota bacterium]